MVPPGDIGPIPIWVGVYVLFLLAAAAGGYAIYQRVFRLVLQGRTEARFDRPIERLTGAMAIVLGQKKVLQRVPFGDWAGLGHAAIFWGFLTFMLSYAIFIFAAAAWKPFPEWLLTETGAMVYSSYLDILAGVLLVVLIWAAVRRWVVRPRRLSFDLTRNPDAIIIVGMIGGLMASTLLTHSFYVAEGSTGPEADVIIGGALGRLFIDWGISESAASVLQGLFWWIHFAIILFFTVYIPFSKHMHMVAAPVNAFFRTLESRGALPAMDLENAERFGASRVQDFTWKQLLDGYACAVCGRCSDVCPANVTGKLLSPMHIVENLKDHMVEIGHQGARDPEHVEPIPILNNAIPESAIWDCLNCGARDAMERFVEPHSGLLLENKGASLALHYRSRPDLEDTVQQFVASLDLPVAAERLQGRKVVEVKPRQVNKGTAIRAYMSEPPCAGRTPVFVGDDVTDESGFAVVNELGGVSVKVGAGSTVANWTLPDVSHVLDWLAEAIAGQHSTKGAHTA